MVNSLYRDNRENFLASVFLRQVNTIWYPTCKREDPSLKRRKCSPIGSGGSNIFSIVVRLGTGIHRHLSPGALCAFAALIRGPS